MDTSKDAVAERLANAHFGVDAGIVSITRLRAPGALEAEPDEPVKLLEVNEHTTADGVVPVYFGPHAASGVLYPSVIVEVTPAEYEELRRDPSRLPHGWQFGELYARPSPVPAGR